MAYSIIHLCVCYAMKSGIVYFLQASTGQIKIGFTRNLIERFSTLQVGNHEQLTVLAAHFGERSEESDLHARFHRFLIRGEWFNPDQEVLDHVGAVPKDISDSFNTANAGRCAECPSRHRTMIELEPGVYTSLCQRCLMARDGRLQAFKEFASRKGPRKEKQPCSNCGRPTKPLRRGRCGMCNEHLRKHGVERPKDAEIGLRLFCAKGHSLQGANVGIARNGKRFCRVCPIRTRQRRWQHQCDAVRRDAQPT